MTLHELFDVDITDKQIDQLHRQCLVVLGEIEAMLNWYNAPQGVKDKIKQETERFDEYVKNRCQSALELGRGTPLQQTLIEAYLTELTCAVGVAGLHNVHADIDEDANPTLKDKRIFFEVDKDYNLCAGVYGYSLETGEAVKDVFQLGAYNDCDEPIQFQDLYTDLLIDAIFERGIELVGENARHRLKYEISADLNNNKYGDDLYKFINRHQNKETSFPTLDAVLTGKDKEKNQTAASDKSTEPLSKGGRQQDVAR